jgi:hypothetical protein
MQRTISAHLAAEAEMGREDALDAFIAVLNVVQPSHPYGDPYPVTRDDVEYGVTRSYLARCGPRKYGRKVSYKTRMTYINQCSRERHLALLTHEVTHITVGSHSEQQGGVHPPRFWTEMAVNALIVQESLSNGDLARVFPDADPDRFLEEVVEDPNGSTVDRRYWTVAECKQEIAQILEIEH